MELNTYLVTVLSILVTVLIVWQIFNLIDFNRRIRNAKKDIKTDLKNYIKVEVDKAKHEAIGTTLYNLAESMVDVVQYNHAITCYMKALWNLYKENPISVEVDMCFEKIDMILDEMEKNKKTLLMQKSAIEGYLNEFDKINDRRKDRIVSYFIGLKPI